MKIVTDSELVKFVDLKYGSVFRSERRTDYCLKINLDIAGTIERYNCLNLQASSLCYIPGHEFVRYYPNAEYVIHPGSE